MNKKDAEQMAKESYVRGWADAQNALANVFLNFSEQDPEYREFYTDISKIIRNMRVVTEDESAN